VSFCRWSSMRFKCDLYCYEHVDGTYTTHVATNKVWTYVPPMAPFTILKYGWLGWLVWKAAYNIQMFSLKHGLRRELKGPYAGMTFKDETPEEFKETLLMLRKEGYRFPDSVLTAVQEDIDERSKVGSVSP